jgi:mannose-6-phosphate isomerase-like protein (cupin superfamily)
MIVRNWREIQPWLFEGDAEDWRIFSQIGKKEKADYMPIYNRTAVCLKTILYLSYARLHPGGAYVAHANIDEGQQSEEIYCFINGHGTVRWGENDIRKVSIGDIFYTPGGQIHHLINDGDEWIDFIAWGADVTEEEIRQGVVKNWRTSHPVLWHGWGIRWRMLDKIGNNPKDGSIPCQRVLNYADYCWLQGESSCEPHAFQGEEAIFFIISGKGVIRIGEEKEKIRNGDSIYIPPDTDYQLINDHEEPIQLYAFGANV